MTDCYICSGQRQIRSGSAAEVNDIYRLFNIKDTSDLDNLYLMAES